MTPMSTACTVERRSTAASSAPRSGYALLFVCMMAATVAVMLYMQVPRVAFEAQREKEQLLIDRGEQFKRAIQLYVRKFNRYPADLDALENTQNIRFLRRKYKDPMTGKDEWRLIHVGPAGQFTDSLVYGNQQKKDQQSAPQTFITELQQIGGNAPAAGQGINLAARRRASDDPGAAGADPNNPNNPSPGGLAGGPVMVLPDGRIVPATPTGIPAATNPTAPGASPLPGQPGQPGQLGQFGQPGQPGQFGLPGQPLPPGQFPPGFQNNPNTPSGPSGNAANLINQILTTPRPGGLNGTGGYQPVDPNNPNGGQPGLGGQQVTGNIGSLNGLPNGNNTGTPLGQTLGGSVVGAGVAGVASKLEQDGIKSYNDRTAYNEWEFVYDLSKDTSRTGGQKLPTPSMQPGGQSLPAGSTPGSPSSGPAPPPVPPPSLTSGAGN